MAEGHVGVVAIEAAAVNGATIVLGSSSTPEVGGATEKVVADVVAAVVAACRHRTEACGIVGTQIIAHCTLFRRYEPAVVGRQ